MVWINLKIFWHGDVSSAGDSERNKKQKKREKEIGRQHQSIYRYGVWRFLEGSGKYRKIERYCCDIICGVLSTVKVKNGNEMTRFHDSWTSPKLRYGLKLISVDAEIDVDRN